MKEKELQEAVSGLGASERSLVEEYYYSDLRRWARLIDNSNSYTDVLESFPESSKSNFQQLIGQYDRLLQQISSLNIGQNANSADQLRNSVSNFKDQYYMPLIVTKQQLQAASSDTGDIEALKKVVADAKRERKNFEKSFQENLEKQSSNSARTMAAHFQRRLEDIKSNNETNPQEWLKKRDRWFWGLVGVIIIMVGAYTAIAIRLPELVKDLGVQIILIKAAIVALFYLQYHFATKNYHIYADLVVRYEHLVVISQTMTDFIAVAFDDEKLREAVFDTSSKTLFAEMSTGHLKDQRDSTNFENVINQLPGVK